MRNYAEAFGRAHRASGDLLDEFAIAERRLGREEGRAARARALGVDPIFDPARAVYFASDARPPMASATRRALDVVVAYNEGLLALAEGRALSELRGEAARLGSELLALGSVVAGGPVLAGLPAILPLLSTAADRAQQAASRATFREEFLKGFPTVDRILSELRAGAPTMFVVLTTPGVDRLRRARLDGADLADRAAVVARHEAYRTALSDWVVLLDEARLAMGAVKTALETASNVPGTPGIASAADMAGRAALLRDLSAAVRAALLRARGES
ncbi:hypothetical protein [Sabulicella glaciei]|uniref:Uncharacterized protein n=1 Tax=Sabulicella glaciei TaxID=2984948 RepID=A0ABT3NSY5_9PROT|nr:hypothetical protein [Roseococcus sp. MDT2-1-1]MCW8085275.1 hypothetical protein [Roseococcus sp. MDT2-1-1]